MKEHDEFYVGYIPEAPRHTAFFIKRVVCLFLIATAIIILVIVTFQKEFAASTFEYGKFTTLHGEISNTPVPHLSISIGSDATGKEIFQSIILVSPVKAGADQIVKHILKTLQIGEGSLVSLKGYLIYNDGHALLQISEEDNDAKIIGKRALAENYKTKPAGNIELSGEVIDPKCYLGVMKPGEGKAHRACAIRCISGGMPAVLHVDNSGEYFLILDEEGNTLNQEVLPFVGDHLTFTGQQLIWNDWKILQINKKNLVQMVEAKHIHETISAFESGISLCDMP